MKLNFLEKHFVCISYIFQSFYFNNVLRDVCITIDRAGLATRPNKPWLRAPHHWGAPTKPNKSCMRRERHAVRRARGVTQTRGVSGNSFGAPTVRYGPLGFYRSGPPTVSSGAPTFLGPRRFWGPDGYLRYLGPPMPRPAIMVLGPHSKFWGPYCPGAPIYGSWDIQGQPALTVLGPRSNIWSP